MKYFTASDKLALWQFLDTGYLAYELAYNPNAGAEAAPAYSNIILADNPIAFWPLNETTGTVANDLSGNGYNGTYSGGFTLAQAAPTGFGVTFDGSSGFVDINPVPPVPPPGGLSVEAWVNITGYNVNAAGTHDGITLIESSEDGNNGFNFAVDQNQGLWLWPSGGEDLLEGSPLSSGWHHLVATQDTSGEIILYVDGLPVVSDSRQYVPGGDGYFRIGHQSWIGGWMQGTMSNMAYYGTVLTPQQILTHYNATPINPEAVVTSQGWTEYYRETSANLVEIIYTKPSSDVITSVPAQATF